MGVVNRIINILVLLFAIVAVVFACLLFNKRERLVDGWAKMATAINSTAKALDAGSGTSLATALDIKNLDHKKYDSLPSVLPKLAAGATALNKERDGLAESIKAYANTLDLPFTDEDLVALKKIETYDTKRNDVKASVEKVQKRIAGVTAGVLAAGHAINIDLDENALKDNDGFADPISKFNDRVGFVKKKGDDLANFITQAAKTIDAPNVDLSDATYAATLSDTSNYITQYKENFEKTKKDLAEAKESITDLNNQIAQKSKEIDTLNLAVSEKDAFIKKLKLIIDPDGTGAIPDLIQPKTVAALKLIKGKVVDINTKWDFVAIDVGAASTVAQKIGKKENVVLAPIPVGKTMTVARGLTDTPEFVGKIKITKVSDNSSIANIMPSPKGTGKIQVGDVVYFSDEDLAEAPAAADAPKSN